MKFEQIKNELIKESESLLNLNKYKTKPSNGLDKLTAKSEHLKTFDDYSKVLIDKLNEIVNKHELTFENDSEKDEFMNFIRPTIIELSQKHIRN